MIDHPNILPDKDVTTILKNISTQLDLLFKNQPFDQEIYNRLSSIYIPLAYWINQQHESTEPERPVIIGINGALGAGKSTLTRLLKVILEYGFNKSVLNLSIDDLYFSKDRRLTLANEIHPLLTTRGVPGTHDVQTGIQLLEQCRAGNSAEIKVPVFDKSIDDLQPEDKWPKIQLPVDIVLFEGWCVGAIPQSDQALFEPVNELESAEDPDGVWRNFVNQQLKGEYQRLFGFIDKLIMMKVPSMQSVMQWRNEQEESLSTALMSKEEIARFILHDERLIEHQLSEMPGRADMLLNIGEDHQISTFN